MLNVLHAFSVLMTTCELETARTNLFLGYVAHIERRERSGIISKDLYWSKVVDLKVPRHWQEHGVHVTSFSALRKKKILKLGIGGKDFHFFDHIKA